jgi:mRNA-degrading endonuclease RelE of RelBE toxin-antitoxin system
MRYEFKPSFERSIKALPAEQKAEIKGACLAFLDLLDLRTKLPVGSGLARLEDDYWEIRKGLKFRILFRWRKDAIEFILAGSHDSIKDLLKNSSASYS